VAPVLGWAAYSAVAFPVLSLVGFGAGEVRGFSLVCLGAALGGLWRGERPAARMPAWMVIVALAMAVLPTMAILPKNVVGGILLAPPIFDHAKIAIVDGILRGGIPVGNPFYGPGGPGDLGYYYLWHFSVAALAGALHTGAWAADAAMTGFTAFASVMLMMALALAIGAPRVAGAAVVLLSLPGSMRTLLTAWLGSEGGHRIILRESDLGGWLNQAAWVPQHLASACSVLAAALLMLRLAEGGGLLVAVVLGLTVAAAFESSVWVGGFAFAAAWSAVGVMLLWNIPTENRRGFLVRSAIAVVFAGVLTAPFVVAELQAAAVRGGGGPIALGPYPTLGKLVPGGWRRALDAPAFWMILLPFSLPAIVPLGMAGAWRSMFRPKQGDQYRIAVLLAVVAVGCLGVAWLFRSTIDNNDLGWRAALPAILVLIVFAARLLARLVGNRSWGVVAAALALGALGLPQMTSMMRFYVCGQGPGDPAGFVASQSLWDAVRRHAGPDDRIANNPLFEANVTPWPVNISWALLSDRPSCYAGWPTVIAFGAIPRAQLLDIRSRFARVFSGAAIAGDVAALAGAYDCRVAVVARTDGAWAHDPFATSQEYRLVEGARDWRIYMRRESR